MLFKVIDVSFVSLQPGIFFLNAMTVGEIESIYMVKKNITQFCKIFNFIAGYNLFEIYCYSSIF